MSQSQSASQQAQSQYFDLHMSGIGYLSRVRDVPTDNGPVLACNIAALRGKRDDAQYTYCDVYVVGQRAKEIVKMLEQDVLADRKVLIGFKLGDPSAQAYEVREGESQGEIRTVIRGRLLKITMAKVDQEFVDLPEDENQQQHRPQQNDRRFGNQGRRNDNDSRGRQFSRDQGQSNVQRNRDGQDDNSRAPQYARDTRQGNAQQSRDTNGSQGRQFSRNTSQSTGYSQRPRRTGSYA